MPHTPGLIGVSTASAFCVALLLARFHLDGTDKLAPLAFNLLLAWIPFLLSATLRALPRLRGSLRAALLTLWLLFLPNAPYLLTDLVHLKHRPPIPHWYDIALFSMFSFAGLMLGAASMGHVYEQVARRLGGRAAWGMSLTVSALCGLGIYLGRVLRWSSWDAVTRPGALLADLAPRLLSPGLWGMTAVLGGVVMVAFIVRPESWGSDRA